MSFSSLAQPGDWKLLGLKLFYAKTMWRLRSALGAAGLYDREVGEKNAHGRYFQSLFAIYDISEMHRLDLAWWTFDAMAWTEEFLKTRSAPNVFEYGSGASTLWLARRASHVTSVEDDPNYYRMVASLKPDNVDYKLIPADAEFEPNYASLRRDLRNKSYRNYVDAVRGKGLYDLIIVDGRCRRKCMALAADHLKPGGAILLDNTDMARYRGLKPAREMRVLTTRGLTPCLPYPTETTIFY